MESNLGCNQYSIAQRLLGFRVGNVLYITILNSGLQI